ncbi:hypothetical protein NDN08_005309 [Rhodosorus marinus]|uniref:Uncharacterized protein n=1 Tax=Rhodosorus marinus TaxID=101924 RepID=A0AAV8V307_9RHOD|nr:hypothetical protein NDN08_005309 [Rhodosorus marinus]
MKHGLVAILLAGICGLAAGEAATCASLFNPMVSSFRSLPSCYQLVVESEPVGIVTNSDVVKTQGPNKGETCVRFTFVVRNGLGIRRVKVGLWNREIPQTNLRFTRKRKFLDSEPTTVRVDACLDDIQTETDCCTGEETKFLVAEAKVRMENGKVVTATLSRSNVTGVPETVTCGNVPPVQACDHIPVFENGDGFLQCEFKFECENIGGEPEFIGVNRIDLSGGSIEVVISPSRIISPGSLQISVYEDPGTAPGAIAISARALTVFDRPAVAVETFNDNSFAIATFLVSELPLLNAVGVALTTSVGTTPRDARFSVRAEERISLQFIRFASLRVIAATGPLFLEAEAEDSKFGPLPDSGIVGRIGSVICGFCRPATFFPIGEWKTLPVPQTQPLNSGQFQAELFRRPGVCIFDGEPGEIGSVCGPQGEQGVRRKIRWFLRQAKFSFSSMI